MSSRLSDRMANELSGEERLLRATSVRWRNILQRWDFR